MKNGHISLSITESEARQIETDFSKAQSARLAAYGVLCCPADYDFSHELTDDPGWVADTAEAIQEAIRAHEQMTITLRMALGRLNVTA